MDLSVGETTDIRVPSTLGARGLFTTRVFGRGWVEDAPRRTGEKPSGNQGSTLVN